jgi:hypothetical protein
MKVAVRHAIRWALTLHIYASMAGFLLVLLFGITGLTLNHAESILGPPHRETTQAALPAALVQEGNRAAIVSALQRALGSRSPATDYRASPDEIDVTLSGPGHWTQAIINRRTGAVDASTESRGVIGRLNDLHTGAASGAVWKWIIDLGAVLFIFSAITGMITLLSMPKRRVLGLLAAAGGVVVLLALYFIWVPR